MQLGLTREADYAVRAMLALVAGEPSVPLSSRRIAEEWRIPRAFLVQVLGRLADRGLVTAALGRNGGYRLARPASQITLLDVVTAIESQPTDRRCVLRGSPCLPDGSCLVHEAFTAARTGSSRSSEAARSPRSSPRKAGDRRSSWRRDECSGWSVPCAGRHPSSRGFPRRAAAWRTGGRRPRSSTRGPTGCPSRSVPSASWSWRQRRRRPTSRRCYSRSDIARRA